MSYTVEHKVGNHIYLCRITSYWDKEKKQPRQHREYIGKKDPKTGEIIQLRSHLAVPVCKHYGSTFLLYNIAQSIGLTDVLKELFEREWDQILACSFFEIIEKRPLYLCEQWAHMTHLETSASLSSQRLSDLLHSLGEQSGKRLSFSKMWAKTREEKEYIAFDITSISSYAELIELVEFGYNRDKEDLPQINLGMLFGYTSMLPIFYTVYPGSVRDVSTLENMIAFTEHLELRNVIFVFDKGFYSEVNIKGMIKNKRNFLISVPFTVAAARELVVAHRKKIGDTSNSFIVNDNVGFGIESKITIGHKRLMAYVYVDKRKKLLAEEKIVRQLEKMENYLETQTGKDTGIVEAHFDKEYKQWRAICALKKSGKRLTLLRNRDGIADALTYEGTVVIVSNGVMEAREVLSLYRDKDVVEKAFDNLKNELDAKRLRVHSEVSMQGRLFIAFISLILYSAINKIMKENNLYQSYTFEEMMRELHKISIVNLGTKQMFTEITKKQKKLMKIFKIQLPQNT